MNSTPEAQNTKSQQNTATSQKLFELALQTSPGGVHSPVRAFKNVGTTPRFIEYAQGSRLRDVDGNEYVDFCNAWGALIYGHQDPLVADAVRSALDRGWVYGMTDPYSLQLCQLIKQAIPWLEKVRLTNSGTESVMAAIRVARAATGRAKILKFDGCYHGHCDSMLVRAGSGLAEMAVPDSAGVTPATAAETLVAPLDDLEALENILKTSNQEIAAVIIEPLPANNGLLIQRMDYLKSVRELCSQYNVLLIFDEVISGFRVSLGGMAELSGVIPDLVTYGKVMGGGTSIAAFGGSAKYMDLVAPSGPVYQAGTYSANAIGVSAAMVTIDRLKKEPPYQDLAKKTDDLCLRLNRICEAQMNNKLLMCWQSFASIFWPVFFEPGQTPCEVRVPEKIPSQQKKHFASYFRFLLEQGIMLSPSGYEVGFLSVRHTNEDLSKLIDATQKYLEQS